MSKFSTVLIGLLTVAVALAGCTSGDSTDGAEIDSDADPTTVDLGNKGAISGLVVDDNYRPIQLKEEWGAGGPGDFQDVGFVLILETAQRFETNENGEFNVLPLEPGTYTIRVAADNHEAIDQTIDVVAGEFTEATIEARRTFSQGGTTLSQEEVIFVACAASLVAVSAASLPGGCGDTSGDSERFDFWTDYSAIKEDVRGIVTEMRASQDGYYGVLIRVSGADWCTASALGQCYFAEFEVANGRYAHNVLYPNLQYVAPGEYLEPGQDGYCRAPEDGDKCRTYGLNLDYNIQTALFADPATRYFTDQVYAASPISWGAAGVTLGTKAQFLQTVYLYELPEEGIEDFCALCDDAVIPE